MFNNEVKRKQNTKKVQQVGCALVTGACVV
jgi:hypothetical protein